MSYCHYHDYPKYRCENCGRRCGPNGHAGCGNAELLNDIPDLAMPFMVGLLWFVVSFAVGPICLMFQWGGVWSAWCVIGGVLVGLTTFLVITMKITDAATKTKHKQQEMDRLHIIAEGMKAGKTADVISRELDEYDKNS